MFCIIIIKNIYIYIYMIVCETGNENGSEERGEGEMLFDSLNGAGTRSTLSYRSAVSRHTRELPTSFVVFVSSQLINCFSIDRKSVV